MTDSRGVAALERVAATRYVTPLREGGSLPGLVEADDDGIYVLKFRGAGQGVKVLVAEILVTEIARLLGIPVPRLALVTLDAQIAKYEADEEVQDLLNASIGLNLGVDFLPGSFGYDGSVPPPEDAAARIVWLDALHRQRRPHLEQPEPAALAPAHLGDRPRRRALLPPRLAQPPARPRRASPLSGSTSRRTCCARSPANPAAQHGELAAMLTPAVLASVVDLVPEEWLETTPWLPDAHRRPVRLPRDAARPAGQPGRRGYPAVAS